LPKCLDYTGIKGSHSANKKTKFWIQQRSKEATEGPLVWEHRTVRCTPDSVRCARGLQLELATFGKFWRRSAIIHRTVRCTPDSVRCSMETRPPELASLGNSLKPLRYNSPDCPVYTGLSGEPRSNDYFRANGHLQAHLMRALRAQASGAPIPVHRTMNSSCPVYTGHPGGPTVRSSNGQNPTATMTWQGAPDCPVCTGLSGAPSNRQPLQRPFLVVGTINTPTTPPFITSKFSTSQLLQEL
jgi:hypothetical protein